MKAEKVTYQLGDSEVYLLISEFNGYVSIGFRVCVKGIDGNTLIPTYNGINLILPQYFQLKKIREEVQYAINVKSFMKWDLPFEGTVETVAAGFDKEMGVLLYKKSNNTSKKEYRLTQQQFEDWVGLIQIADVSTILFR